MTSTMPNKDAPSDGERSGASRPEPAMSDAVSTTEVYETDEGVVFYDAEHPLAWIQTSKTVRLTDAA
ncbi:DUF7331 family protein [Natronomonas sp. EA1]|uniref:DUF7331 family protein n=1 Tax=Natronomonas sp. EA1 TaxID=3421655 RepID=UPI003EBA6246